MDEINILKIIHFIINYTLNEYRTQQKQCTPVNRLPDRY